MACARSEECLIFLNTPYGSKSAGKFIIRASDHIKFHLSLQSIHVYLITKCGHVRALCFLIGLVVCLVGSVPAASLESSQRKSSYPQDSTRKDRYVKNKMSPC